MLAASTVLGICGGLGKELLPAPPVTQRSSAVWRWMTRRLVPRLFVLPPPWLRRESHRASQRPLAWGAWLPFRNPMGASGGSWLVTSCGVWWLAPWLKALQHGSWTRASLFSLPCALVPARRPWPTPSLLPLSPVLTQPSCPSIASAHLIPSADKPCCRPCPALPAPMCACLSCASSTLSGRVSVGLPR